MAKKSYPNIEYVHKCDSAVLQCNRLSDKKIEAPRELPGNIILVHGVNDVGMGYHLVEQGLCAGLQERLKRYFKPASYKVPSQADKNKVEKDPDAVFFKRTVTDDTDSPVIPFYWGYREVGSAAKTINGQRTDRYDTRLDKDLSKGGGPFGNATSSLPDMWNRGVYAAADPVGDPLRPIKTGPGRMYMVLAAMRLAALISMIRQFEPKDTVNLVAHSQGCLLSLLAQAILMEKGERTADTLILTHPPYSLDDEMNILMKGLTFFRGGKDLGMDDTQYELIDGRQSIRARLQTLVNIVQGVARNKATDPAFESINEEDCGGMVAGCWKPSTTRDNRGKVYLYFCPEDMTVALDNMRGIGWQGVPDYIIKEPTLTELTAGGYMASAGIHLIKRGPIVAKPMAELGQGFFQRVFTNKLRVNPRTRKPEPVRVGDAPEDFALRVKGEDDHAHVARTVRNWREMLPIAKWPIDPKDSPRDQRVGIRTINGELLNPPCVADLRGNQINPADIPAHSRLSKVPLKERGPSEEVDPITAAIAVTADGGVNVAQEELTPAVAKHCSRIRPGPVSSEDLKRMQEAYNAAKNPGRKSADKANTDDDYKIVSARVLNSGTVVADVMESPNAARKRWQKELSEKSFHSAIFDSIENHRRVTAHDVSIGSGKASSHAKFYAYLCAVADWRLTNPTKEDELRKGILTWDTFIEEHSAYYKCEPDWIKELIVGNVNYYSSGKLPKCLPILTGKLWDIVVSETTSGQCVGQSQPTRRKP